MMNFVSHGTQDMFPTFLKVHRALSPKLTAIVTIVANFGAIAGGICCGLFSGSLRPSPGHNHGAGLCNLRNPSLGLFPDYRADNGGRVYDAVHGSGSVGGNCRAHNRAFTGQCPRLLPGFAYQCGVLLAGSVGFIEALFAERMNYANAMAGTALTIFCFCILVVALGRENRGIEFGK